MKITYRFGCTGDEGRGTLGKLGELSSFVQ